MNQKYIWIGLGVLAVIVTAVLVVNNNSNSDVASDRVSGDAMMEEKDDAMMDDDAMMAKDEDKMMSDDKMGADDVMMKKSGSYKDYSESTVSSEQKAGNKVVLFFYAPWCPYCRAADAAFKASPEKIPAGVTLLKTDYDSNTEFKKKYGVTTQHTFVQIDNNGNQITKWVSGDVDLLIKNVK